MSALSKTAWRRAGVRQASLMFSRRITPGLVAVSMALFSATGPAQPRDPQSAGSDPGSAGSFHMDGVAGWFEQRFTEAELQTYRPEEFRIEAHACSCSDRPVPHYPYLMVFFSTPKGDLVGRPDRRGVHTVITRLAVRHGEQYCDVDAEDQCYGTFAHPCEFSDFRYGRQLAEYFPTCKAIESETELTPVHYRVD